MAQASDFAVLLVDPFVSAQYLSESFARLGVHTTALYTVGLNEITAYHAPKPDYFDEQIQLGSRCMDDITAALGTRRFDYVFNGSDGAVEVADRIAKIATPESHNDPASVSLRTDKRRMQDAVARAGLAHIAQREINGLPTADDPVLFGLTWPCFIKPSRGGGSVGIARLDDYCALTSYFDTVNQDELLGEIRTSIPDDYALTFLLSEYVEGRECFVDTFSYRGQHHVSSIQAYTKQNFNGRPLYRTCEVITDREITDSLTKYVSAVLDSVGLANGFAHTEVFIQDNGEPVLIEVNPRISGGSGWVNRLAAAEGLLSQPELFKAVASGTVSDTNYVPPESITARILFLSNISGQPVGDLTKFLEPFATVQSVHQLKPVGYVHPHHPQATSDFVGLLLCKGEAQQLADESTQILHRDLEGW